MRPRLARSVDLDLDLDLDRRLLTLLVFLTGEVDRDLDRADLWPSGDLTGEAERDLERDNFSVRPLNLVEEDGGGGGGAERSDSRKPASRSMPAPSPLTRPADE